MSKNLLFISGLLLCLVVSSIEGSFQNFFSSNYDDNYKLNWSLNPACGSLCVNRSVSIVDVSESISNQRWLWDVSQVPGIYSVFTRKEDEPAQVSWKDFLAHHSEGTLRFGNEAEPDWTSAVILESLIEVNDTSDNMRINYSRCGMDDSYCRIYPMELFTWERKVLVNTSTHLTIQFLSNQSAFSLPKEKSGRINVTLSAFVKEGYGFWLPHLAHSYRTTEVDVQFDGLNTGSNFTHGRFGLQILIGSSNPKGKFSRRQTESLNDEHTPGIFKTNELLFPGRNESEGAYIQWRPIVYTKPHRGLADSTGVSMSKGSTVNRKKEAFKNSSLFAMYGKKVVQFSSRYYYVTFGAPKDGFYNKTRYNAWTFTLGHGDPIDGTLSSDIILASCMMAVAVFLSILISSSFCLFKRWKNRMNEPQFSYGQI